MNQITISNRQRYLKLPSEWKIMLEELADRCLARAEKRTDNRRFKPEYFGAEGFSLEVALVGEREIRQLNVSYREKDAVTDVLSFPMIHYVDGAPNPGVGDIDLETQLIVLGEVCVCHKRAITQAEEYGHSVRREVAFLVAHGILHLLGFDHETTEDAALMQAEQELILSEMGINRDGEA